MTNVPKKTILLATVQHSSWSFAFGAIPPILTYIVMAYIVMAYIVMAYIVMAYIVMTYIVMAFGAIRPMLTCDQSSVIWTV